MHTTTWIVYLIHRKVNADEEEFNTLKRKLSKGEF